jgi:hypothetical protein
MFGYSLRSIRYFRSSRWARSAGSLRSWLFNFRAAGVNGARGIAVMGGYITDADQLSVIGYQAAQCRSISVPQISDVGRRRSGHRRDISAKIRTSLEIEALVSMSV